MNLKTLRCRLAGIIGNVMEHYDNALFGLLAPFISPLFFEASDPLTALILTYGMIPLGVLTRPLGSLFFGWVGDSFGRRQALFGSLLGMAVVTVTIGFLPLYRDVGIWAPLGLALARMSQSFFAAGESTGGAIFILEHTEISKRGLVSSFYDASSIGGILIASGLVTFFSMQGYVEEGWRFLFWGGALTAVFGIFLRWKTQDGQEFVASAKSRRTPVWQLATQHKAALVSLILASGFSYTTYSLAFTLMNGYVPLVTSITKAEVMQVNTGLLIFDMMLLPLFGYLANRWGKEKVMLSGAFLSAIGAIPLFYFLDHSSLGTVIGVRVAIVTFGVAFAAPYHAWALEQVPSSCRYTILSLGYTLGSQLIGAPTSAICLWLYKTMKWGASPGLYLLTIALIASYVVFRSIKSEKQVLASNT